MHDPQLYRWMADAVLVLHVGIVLFVVGGLALIVIGNMQAWPWVNGWRFRMAHLATIGLVAAEAWWGVVCPLTTLEMWLRRQARGTAYDGGFIEHWLHLLLFWSASPWVFTAAYSVFGLAVVAAWWRFPPKRAGRRSAA